MASWDESRIYPQESGYRGGKEIYRLVFSSLAYEGSFSQSYSRSMRSHLSSNM